MYSPANTYESTLLLFHNNTTNIWYKTPYSPNRLRALNRLHTLHTILVLRLKKNSREENDYIKYLPYMDPETMRWSALINFELHM